VANLFGSQTLNLFSAAIEHPIAKISKNINLIQIHGCASSFEEDLRILNNSSLLNNKVYLIHRPDEILEYPDLLTHLSPSSTIVQFGDLLINHPFWQKFKDRHVIAHPFLSMNMPKKVENKIIVGSFTSWGEMRSLEHFFALKEELLKTPSANRLLFWAGGPGSGSELKFFIPHINVQLYHLHGKKRLGESSGSLHRGVSVPVIFEANGVERIEGLKVIKIEADPDLNNIDFKAAAKSISELVESHLDEWLIYNASIAKSNCPETFCNAISKLSKF